LAEKIKVTYKKSINDKEYSSFIKHFGKFTIAKIDEKEVSSDECIRESIEQLKDRMSLLTSKINDNDRGRVLSRHSKYSVRFDRDRQLTVYFRKHHIKLLGEVERVIKEQCSLPVETERLNPSGDFHINITLPPDNLELKKEILFTLRRVIGEGDRYSI